MAIKILDAAIIGQIAAGEVVERPASVVKELIENAIDAGATSITIEIKDGGLSYLRVTDNGCGIPPNQVALAFENHATSKLARAEHLQDIRTLGFRGEALPSIAAVSRVEMTTREKNAASGTRIIVEGGIKQPIVEVGSPEGTTVIVRDLFYNVPARRSFVRKTAYEASLISDLIAKMILGNPPISFWLITNSKNVYHSFGDGKLKHTVFTIYGVEAADKVKYLDVIMGGMRISGLVGVGDMSKPTRAHQAFFINGRNVRCALLTQTLEQACKGRVTTGEYPMCALTLELPPASVDVNVHPNKLEVRFRDGQGIRASVGEALKQAFSGDEMLPLTPKKPKETLRVTIKQTDVLTNSKKNMAKQTDVVSNDKSSVTEQTEDGNAQTDVENKQTKVRVIPNYYDSRRFAGLFLNEDENAENIPSVQSASETQENETVTPENSVAPTSEPYRVIGTIFNTYILLELEDSMLIIDQHAAHERIMYDKYTKRAQNGETTSQELLIPVIIDVTAREMALINEHAEALEKAGYYTEVFGERSVSLRAVPFILGKAEAKPAFMETLNSLSGIMSLPIDTRAAEIAMMACKSAVKAGDKLTEGEITSLINAMRKTGAAPTCPHGRPITRAITKKEFEKFFKRIQ